MRSCLSVHYRVSALIAALALSLLFALLTARPSAAKPSYAEKLPEIEAWLTSHADLHLKRLTEFISIPSVSANPERKEAVRRGAEWLRDDLTDAGLENARILESAGHPSVYADWLHAGASAPTVLIYGHLDVQPEDPVSKWTSPPFNATLRGDRLYGRGASDNKGNLYVAVSALRAALAVAGELPVNVKVLFEGEEEIGSPNLPQLLDANIELLRADMGFSADGGQVDEATPGLFMGLRGAIGLEVFITTASTDVHSGTYGGGLQNPVHVLTQLIAGLRDPESGRVLVEGFYDDLDEITEDMKKDIAEFPRTQEQMLSNVGSNESIGITGRSFYERTWLLPSLDVVGITGGFQGEGIKTVIPKQASVKLSVRTAGHQDSETMLRGLEKHVEKAAAKLRGASVRTERMSMFAEAFSASPNGVAANAVSTVLEGIYGRPPKRFRLGGSIPAVGLAARKLVKDVTMMAFGLPDECMHAPDEFIRLASLRRGEKAYVRVLHEVAKRWAERGNGKEEL